MPRARRKPRRCRAAGVGTASAADLPSALDAAGQLQRLPVEIHAGFAWVRVAGGVQFQINGTTKSVLFYGDGVVRVSAHKGETYTKQPSLVVVASPQAPQLDIAESADALTIASPGLRVVVDKRAGTLAFQRPDGTPPIDEFPLFVRAGSILPLGPVVQYVDEQPDAPYEIRIYPGADGRFTLYEDDGETYRYEKGEYATVALAWDDARRTLRIGARSGFPDMTAQRTLNVRLMRLRPGGRMQAKTVRFGGEAVELQFTP